MAAVVRNTGPRIVVVGSLNVDSTYHVDALPRPGETIRVKAVSTTRGGKGANQAVAAARAGGAVSIVGCVGNDAPGAAYRAALEHEGIATDLTRTVDDATGAAVIALDERGGNMILVHPGANGRVASEDVVRAAGRIREAEILLIQLEVPLAALREAVSLARSAGVRVILNPSPWLPELRDDPLPVDAMIVNEHEASLLTGRTEDELVHAREGVISALPADLLVVTRGAAGSLTLSRSGECVNVDAFPVTPVDTVGAGDAFAGALAVALGEGRPLVEAIRFANAAGALATLQVGAQAATPSRTEIEALLRKQT